LGKWLNLLLLVKRRVSPNRSSTLAVLIGGAVTAKGSTFYKCSPECFGWIASMDFRAIAPTSRASIFVGLLPFSRRANIRCRTEKDASALSNKRDDPADRRHASCQIGI